MPDTDTGSAPMSGTVKVPGIGPVKKQTAMLVSGGVVLLIGIVLYRKKQASDAANAATAANSSAASSATQGSIDPETGYPYGSSQDEAALAALQNQILPTETSQGDGEIIGYDDEGNPIYGVGGSSGGLTSNFTTNAQWAQAAQQYLVNTAGADSATVNIALGEYITGQAVSATQQQVVEQAIAYENLPPVAGPNGFPPSINTGTPSTTAPGGSKVTLPKYNGMRVEDCTASLTKLGLVGHFSPSLASRKPNVAYYIESMTPAGGSSVAAGSTVDFGIGTKK